MALMCSDRMILKFRIKKSGQINWAAAIMPTNTCTRKSTTAKLQWKYLSYFAFGEYAHKPVVNVRLKNALDIGQIRARCRENDANAEYDRTEDTVGPLAASKIAVKAGETTKVPTWHSFYLERSQGYMSRFWTHASSKAGNGNET